MVHDLVADRTTVTDVTAPNRLVFDVSDGRIAYRPAGGDEIFVYDVRAQSVTRIAEAPHAVDGPVIRGDVVLWSTGRDPARFRGVRGQSLLGPEDFRTVHKHNLATGRTTVTVREQFGVRRLRSDEQGRVYATVSLRTSATADTPVALRRW